MHVRRLRMRAAHAALAKACAAADAVAADADADAIAAAAAAATAVGLLLLLLLLLLLRMWLGGSCGCDGGEGPCGGRSKQVVEAPHLGSVGRRHRRGQRLRRKPIPAAAVSTSSATFRSSTSSSSSSNGVDVHGRCSARASHGSGCCRRERWGNVKAGRRYRRTL